MAYSRDRHRHGKGADDSDDDDGRVWFFLPSEDIDFDVLASDLRCYLGNGAQVEIGNHHRNRRPGYHIKSAVPITTKTLKQILIVGELNVGNITSEVRGARLQLYGRLTNLSEDYRDSYTHRSREANGPSQQAPTAASYKQSLEREKQSRPSQGRREPQAIPERRHEREEDPYQYPSIISSSTEPNIPPRDPSQYPSSDPSQSEEAAYDHRSTATMSKSSYNYSAPSKGFEHASRRHRESTANVPAGGVSVNYRQTETTIEVNESAYERTAPGNQYSSQPRYTELQIEEAKTDITLILKNLGHTHVSLQEFDRLVNDRLKRLYGSEQQQYQPKPLPSNQGGQKPPTGPVPLTQFTEQGGQKPSPGFVPFTQFAGSGGQNPPPGSVPYNQIPRSEKPPETIQPDNASSYGFPTKKPPETTQPDYTSPYGFPTKKPPEATQPDYTSYGFPTKKPPEATQPDYTSYGFPTKRPPETTQPDYTSSYGFPTKKPPEATQPDYTSSYGFPTKYVTSGGPESNYLEEYNESFTEPSSQPYDSRSGKYKSRDGHYTKR